MNSSRILGIGSYLPPGIVTNDDLKDLLNTSDEWIQQRTGIKQRHWVDASTDIATSDLGLLAAQKALAHAGVDKSEIDLIIFATTSPDYDTPGSACTLQAKLGIPGVPALDIRQQCSGFIYGLSIADQFVRTGLYKKVLLVCAEIQSKGIDLSPRGRDVSVLFGDGAGAIVLGSTSLVTDVRNSDLPHVLCTHLGADGRFAKDLWIEYPGIGHVGSRNSFKEEDQVKYFPQMNGKTVFVNAAKKMPEILLTSLESQNLKIEDVDLFVFHQANIRINEMVAKQLGIPDEKIFNTIELFGNTTAATIPLGLDEAVRCGKLRSGMLVGSAAFGSGFTWGSALIRW